MDVQSYLKRISLLRCPNHDLDKLEPTSVNLTIRKIAIWMSKTCLFFKLPKIVKFFQKIASDNFPEGEIDTGSRLDKTRQWPWTPPVGLRRLAATTINNFWICFAGHLHPLIRPLYSRRQIGQLTNCDQCWVK